MYNTSNPQSAMYKGRLGGCIGVEDMGMQLGYVETDPSGRYGRFKDILGKGAMKTVYKAFDEVLGIEVAWNQVKLGDVFHSPELLQRLYSEVHLLKNLHHSSIMVFHDSWIDLNCRTFNFITELFASGTLRQYRQRYQRVEIRAVKKWARQILRGLEYLHSRNPPVIHRDLKCDNIFVNGHLGQVKIGDLGLAAILRDSQRAHSVIGTPEFMAPELYEEEYNELVDIYSFGMCMIEMLTLEFPYSECSNPAQIFKKVTSGKLPNAFYKIQDLEAQIFVGKCLANVSKRLPAKELLLDPFLATDQLELPTQSALPSPPLPKNETLKLNSTAAVVNVHQTKSTDMTITGSITENKTVFLKVQITDKNGHTRNIYFPFDTMKDTAIEVAVEMIRELEISEWEPLEIAQMIDEEISALVPTWKDQLQHSYNYEKEDYDINNHHPFFLSSSSPSSSHGSPGICSSYNTHFDENHYPLLDWPRDDLSINDDASSHFSMNSFKHSNFHYCELGNESDDDEHDDPNVHVANGSEEPTWWYTSEPKPNNKCTRFCPREEVQDNNNNNNNLGITDCCRFRRSGGSTSKLTRMRSFLDGRRSQQQRRSLMEEIHKRRMFNTVGAIHNIGFQMPHF